MPDWAREVKSYIEGLKLEPAREAEIADELGQHLNDRFEELLAGGMKEEQACQAVKEELSDGRLGANLRAVLPPTPDKMTLGQDEREHWLAGLWKDLRYGTRLLQLNPGFATVAILSLALGTGANTAIFQLLDAVRLRTLPVANPQELADVTVAYHPHGRTGNFSAAHPDLTFAIWQQVREQQQGFASIAAWSSQRMNLSPGGEARYAEGLWVSGNFFDTLGVRPVLGRLLSSSDDRRGCGASGVVISDSFWQREFGGSASVLGSNITLENHPFEIIGVTPPSFFGIEVGRRFDVALPLCAEPVLSGERPRIDSPHDWWLAAIGRLKPGWTIGRASAQLEAISPGIFRATLPTQYDPQDQGDYLKFKLGARPAGTGVSELRRDYESPLWLLMAISGLVLVIACANLANLMLARASARQRELAVRLALGASRMRLIRQLLAESWLLAALGALAGAGLAQALSRMLLSFLSTRQSQLFVNLAPDWRLLSFTAGLAVVTCLVFGLVPALQASRTAPAEVMKAGGRGLTAGRERFAMRRVLVISQVALSLVLLVGALLFVRTLRNLVNLDAGFQREHLLVTDIDLTPLRLPVANRTAYKQELLRRLQAIPGVSSAADVVIVPVSGDGWNQNISFPGTQMQREHANLNQVSPGYFHTLRTPLLTGRDFNDRDTTASVPVAIVTQAFARKFISGADPVGHTFTVKQKGGKPRDITYQVVGLVKDTKYEDLREDFSPIVFLAEAQDDDPGLEARVMIRSDEPMSDVVSSVKRELAAIDPALVVNFRIFGSMLREGLLRERLMAVLAGFLGFLAAVLAMVGLYGVISYMVIRRRNEIGVRMALGANPGQIVAMVMRESGILLGIGLGIGTVLAVAAARAARTLLFGLQPSDPLTLVMAVSSLAAVAALASLLPAQRAAAVDPMVALHDE